MVSPHYRVDKVEKTSSVTLLEFKLIEKTRLRPSAKAKQDVETHMLCLQKIIFLEWSRNYFEITHACFTNHVLFSSKLCSGQFIFVLFP